MQARNAILEREATAVAKSLKTTAEESKYLLESRFGQITIDMEKAIYFPTGILGMPDKLHFCLADFPEGSKTEFKVLQSLDDIELSFVVLPVANENSFIEKQDIEEIATIMTTNVDDIALALVASTHVAPEGKLISVNVRAPIVINTKEKAAAQYVFSHSKYEIRHVLNKKQ